jgi:hypothetical protein
MEASGAAEALQFTVQLAEWYSLHLGTKYVDNGSTGNTLTQRLWEILAVAVHCSSADTFRRQRLALVSVGAAPSL